MGQGAGQTLDLSTAKEKEYPKIISEAVRWYTKAAEQGHASAQNNLGNRYYSGEGVPQEYKQADKPGALQKRMVMNQQKRIWVS